MISRSRQLALVLTAVLAAGAACQARDHTPPAQGRPGPSATAHRGFTLVASGDVLPHTSVIERAAFDAGGAGYDFRPMLSGIRSVVAPADLALCHMETVYGADGDYSGYPFFRSPPEVAAGLAATGYDGCSTASNHTLDDGEEGIRRTLDALDRAGLRHAGSARSAQEAATPALLEAGGARVAHLAYTFGTNGHPLPPDRPWAVNLIDEQRIVADARAARSARRRRRGGLAALGHRVAGRARRPPALPRPLPHRLQERGPPGRRPDPRHPRPCPAGVREGQRHLGGLRHGRPDRRRDDRPRRGERPAWQPVHRRPLHLLPRPPAPAAAGRSPAPSSCPSCTTSTPAGSWTSTRPWPRAPNSTPCATASATWSSAGARRRTGS